MKSITLLAAVFTFLMACGCAPTDTTTASKETAETSVVETTPEPPTSTVLSTHYMDAVAALAADDLEKAKASLTALAKESTGEMKTLAEAAADTGDIAATRERFKALSALAVTKELPEGYAVAFCPM